jgi:hypothetical protein
MGFAADNKDGNHRLRGTPIRHADRHGGLRMDSAEGEPIAEIHPGDVI